MNSPLISIIIPTYNRAPIIGETLDSIIAQTFTNWECIVVDDGSTDNTAEIMAQYIDVDVRFRYFNRPANRQKGPCSCRNYGFEKSKGDYINFFDSDDLFKPMAFKQWLSSFGAGDDAVISKMELMDFKTQVVSKVYEIQSDNLIQDFFVGKINFFVCGPLWRSSFLDKQKILFNESIRNGDDWDFNLRMLYEKPELKFLDEAFIQNRLHDNSLSKERLKLNKNELVSYFDTLDYHLIKVKNQVKVKNQIVKDYVISRYSSYLLLSIKNSNEVREYLFWRLLKKEIELGSYKQLLKTTVGYMSYLLFKKGYRFISFKSHPN